MGAGISRAFASAALAAAATLVFGFIAGPTGRARDDASAQTASPCPARDPREQLTRMVGAERTSAALWPGFVAIGVEDQARNDTFYFCGGVLIDGRTVLTAAHCLDDLKKEADGTWAHTHPYFQGWRLAVLPRADNIRNDAAAHRLQVVSAEIYSAGAERYRRRPSGLPAHDIAILKLGQSAPGPYARLAGARSADPALSGHVLWAAGFGKTSPSSALQSFTTKSGTAQIMSEHLLDAAIPYPGPTACRNGYPDLDGASQLCAGWKRGGRDSCNGDSGGPIVALDARNCPVVVGLTSYGPDDCGGAGQVGVYTRVSHYRSWIQARAASAAFSDAPPPAVGSEAIGQLVIALLELARAHPGMVNIVPVSDGAVRPLDSRGVFIAQERDQIVYRITVQAPLRGQLLLFDRRPDGSYTPLLPNPRFSEHASATVDPARSIEIGGADSRQKLIASIAPGRTVQTGEVVALVVPSSLDLSQLILQPSPTKGAELRTTPSPEVIPALELVASHIRATQAARGESQTGSGVLRYEIHRRP